MSGTLAAPYGAHLAWLSRPRFAFSIMGPARCLERGYAPIRSEDGAESLEVSARQGGVAKAASSVNDMSRALEMPVARRYLLRQPICES